MGGDLATRALDRSACEPEWLARASGLTAGVLASLLPFYLPLADHIAARRAAKGGPLTVGIQGLQGAGKSTLVSLLQRVLNDEAGLAVACLSIDDLYLTRAERADL